MPYIDKKDANVLSVLNSYCDELSNTINILHSVIDLDEIIIDFPSTKLISKLLPEIKQRVNEFHHPLVVSLTSMEHQTHIHGAALNALNQSLESIEKRAVITKN